jgi:hypothetical protein
MKKIEILKIMKKSSLCVVIVLMIIFLTNYNVLLSQNISRTYEICINTICFMDLSDSMKMKVSLTSVDEDSRCPKGVNCVWQGNAHVKLKIEMGDSTNQEVNLDTFWGDQCFRIHGKKIQMISLLPYPELNKKPHNQEYRVVLEVLHEESTEIN